MVTVEEAICDAIIVVTATGNSYHHASSIRR